MGKEQGMGQILMIYNGSDSTALIGYIFPIQGLNFCVLADGAWGGYFKTMIRKSSTEKVTHETGYMPFCPLSDEVREQYENIQRADTITIDPHKSGFCPYPAGALCYRNGTMKNLVAIMHPEVYHGEDDPTMGVYGIEGSKPGAAPTGVYVAHTVSTTFVSDRRKPTNDLVVVFR